jgi:hypothetical protein
MSSSSEQKAMWWGVGAAVVGFIFLFAMVRPFGASLAPARCWSGVSDADLGLGLACDATSGQAGICAQNFGADAIRDASRKDTLKVCVGAGELLRSMNLVVAVVIAGLFGWWVGHENLTRSRKARPPAQPATGT